MVTAARSPLAPHRRISLTLGTLLSCGYLVAVTPEDMPIRFLLRQSQAPVTVFTA